LKRESEGSEAAKSYSFQKTLRRGEEVETRQSQIDPMMEAEVMLEREVIPRP
jgi:hypothetical protein